MDFFFFTSEFNCVREYVTFQIGRIEQSRTNSPKIERSIEALVVPIHSNETKFLWSLPTISNPNKRKIPKKHITLFHPCGVIYIPRRMYSWAFVSTRLFSSSRQYKGGGRQEEEEPRVGEISLRWLSKYLTRRWRGRARFSLADRIVRDRKR